jgi:RHS repeat-associated protein
MVFIGADGTIRPLFSQNPVAPGMTGGGSSGMTQTAVSIHDCAGSGCAATNTTAYFHNDQIGSARMLSEGYGYPVWQGTFTPFGQEVSPQITSNHYKFNGKERGEAAEGSLDYFGARYYSSVLGRWMTPDWSDAPKAIPYAKLTDAQSLNLYSYVTDDPLSHTDLDGHFQSAPANQSCGNTNGDTCTPQVNGPALVVNNGNGTYTATQIVQTQDNPVQLQNGGTQVTTTTTTYAATFNKDNQIVDGSASKQSNVSTQQYDKNGNPVGDAQTSKGPVQNLGNHNIQNGLDARDDKAFTSMQSAASHWWNASIGSVTGQVALLVPGYGGKALGILGGLTTLSLYDLTHVHGDQDSRPPDQYGMGTVGP